MCRRGEQQEVALRVQNRIQIDTDGCREAPDLDFSRRRNVARGADSGVIVDCAQRPT